MGYRHIFIGCLFIILYCVSFSIAGVITNNYEHSVLNPLLLTFYSFFFTIIFFSFVNIKNYKDLLDKVIKNKKLVLSMNISTAANWVIYFYAVKYLEPSITLAIILGTYPLFTFFRTLRQQETQKERFYNILFASLLAALLIALSIEDIAKIPSWHETFVFILLCVLSGIAGSYSNIYGKQLSQLHFSAQQVLGIRFWLVVIVCFIVLISTSIKLWVTPELFLVVIGIAALSIMLPLFFMQKGLEYIDPLFVSFLLPAVPVITYIFQLFEPYYKFSWVKFLLISLLSLTVIISTLVKMKLAKPVVAVKVKQ